LFDEFAVHQLVVGLAESAHAGEGKVDRTEMLTPRKRGFRRRCAARIVGAVSAPISRPLGAPAACPKSGTVRQIGLACGMVPNAR
jgi:hypothetical protein